jgi:copper(I)-binding protein
MIPIRTLAFAGLLSLSVGFAQAHEYKLGALAIDHPWSRETPAAAPVAGGFMKLENTGTAADRLLAVEAAASQKVEIHEMAVVDGVMRMRPLDQGVAIPAGGKVELKPGGYHVMFIGLKASFKKGDVVKGTLVFEKAGRIDVDFNVEAMADKGPMQGHGTGH